MHTYKFLSAIFGFQPHTLDVRPSVPSGAWPRRLAEGSCEQDTYYLELQLEVPVLNCLKGMRSCHVLWNRAVAAREAARAVLNFRSATLALSLLQEFTNAVFSLNLPRTVTTFLRAVPWLRNAQRAVESGSEPCSPTLALLPVQISIDMQCSLCACVKHRSCKLFSAQSAVETIVCAYASEVLMCLRHKCLRHKRFGR